MIFDSFLADAGHNILGIPWWMWLAAGVALTVFAIAAAPELILLAPEVADLALAETTEAVIGESLAEQGVTEAVEQALAEGSAIQDGELGEAVGNAIREGRYAGHRAFIDAYNAALAEQNVVARVAAALGPAMTALGASKIPDVVGDVADQVEQLGSSARAPEADPTKQTPPD
jgi:hypothetical protein